MGSEPLLALSEFWGGLGPFSLERPEGPPGGRWRVHSDTDTEQMRGSRSCPEAFVSPPPRRSGPSPPLDTRRSAVRRLHGLSGRQTASVRYVKDLRQALGGNGLRRRVSERMTIVRQAYVTRCPSEPLRFATTPCGPTRLRDFQSE